MAFLGLHGFTQRGSAWSEVAAAVGGNWHLPDLPGHGTEPVVPWDAAVARVAGFLAGMPAPRVLAGYSQGGRLALAAALEAPDLADRLILVSAGPGIGDARRRAERRAEDEALAGRIEQVGVEAFLEEWARRPLFAGLGARGPEWLARDREERLTNTAPGLAGALRSLGQGAMPYLGDRLTELRVPTLLVTGEQDAAYTAPAREMEGRILQSRLAVIPGAGHALLGECPEAVADAICDWVR